MPMHEKVDLRGARILLVDDTKVNLDVLGAPCAVQAGAGLSGLGPMGRAAAWVPSGALTLPGHTQQTRGHAPAGRAVRWTGYPLGH
jgi:hypothetical protein